MARQHALTELTRRIDAAAAASDWPGLALADREIAGALPALAVRGPWSAAERPALAQLRLRHAAARNQCEQALASTGARLATMRGHKDGWLAYAETHDWTGPRSGER